MHGHLNTEVFKKGNTFRFRNALRKVGDLLLVPEPFCLPADSIDVTNHISPHPYDTHVPLILFGPGIAPARDDRRVSMVDLAPTLGSILGLTPDEPLDGEVLPGFRRR